MEPVVRPIRPIPILAAALATTLALALALPAAGPARAERIPVADMLRGIVMTPAQCAATPSAVWVDAMGRGFCMRYYLSTAGGEGPRPVVFLEGDRFGRLDPQTGQFSPGEHDKDVDTDVLMKRAAVLSRQNKTTAIYLARVGVDGSSGDHRIRRTLLELHATQAALEAIKQRHGLDGFHLVGQSGGSKIVGGLLALRPDIGCAVIGSGRLYNLGPPQPSADPALFHFNVTDSIPIIAQRRSTRIVVITDPADRQVPERAQTPFVNLLREAGGQAEQLIVRATDERRHGVTSYSRLAMTECVRGASREELANNVRQLVEKRVAGKADADKAEQQ